MAQYPYKIKDNDDNIFIFAGTENGHPLYRTNSGIKHIFDLEKYTVIQAKEYNTTAPSVIESIGPYTLLQHSADFFTVDYDTESINITVLSNTDYGTIKQDFTRFLNLKMIINGNSDRMTELVKIELLHTTVYRNILTSKLFCYNFKHGNVWVENIEWNNELTQVKFTITESRS